MLRTSDQGEVRTGEAHRRHGSATSRNDYSCGAEQACE